MLLDKVGVRPLQTAQTRAQAGDNNIIPLENTLPACSNTHNARWPLCPLSGASRHPHQPPFCSHTPSLSHTRPCHVHRSENGVH